MNMAWLIAGGAAATGAITMGWGYVRSLYRYLASYLIVTCQVRGELQEAITFYTWKNFRASQFGPRDYLGWTVFVRPVKRVQMIAMEIVGQRGKIFWKGWRPLSLKRATREIKNDIVVSEKNIEGGTTISFIRGTFNLDKLLIDATEAYNHVQRIGEEKIHPRYSVRHIFGTDGKPIQQGNNTDCAGHSGDGLREWSGLTSQQNRILKWKAHELGPCRINHGDAIGQLALDQEAQEMVQEIQRWRESEDWYKERGIPWKRGWLLYGPPGTGKTSLVRAIAEDFDLPVFVYHLATLYDDEMQRAWQKMQLSVPCIALIEDIDTIFQGRENVAGGHLTFDCVLNCLDGVERAGGILLAVTTNCIEHLDPALGTPTPDRVSSRPGRLDRMLEMSQLSIEGRRQLCQRILAEWPETWEDVIAAGESETGAQFQGRCTQLALNLYWSDK